MTYKLNKDMCTYKFPELRKSILKTLIHDCNNWVDSGSSPE